MSFLLSLIMGGRVIESLPLYLYLTSTLPELSPSISVSSSPWGSPPVLREIRGFGVVSSTGGRGCRGKILRIFGWLCCSGFEMERGRREDLSVPQCIPWAYHVRVYEIWELNSGLWRKRLNGSSHQTGCLGRVYSQF